MTRMVAVDTGCGYSRIHMRSCHMAQRGAGKPWPHGERRTPTQLAIDSARLGFRPCRVCQPFPKPNPAKMPGYETPSKAVVGAAEPQMGVV